MSTSTSTSTSLSIVEQDEAGNVTATYIASSESRVDVVDQLPKESKSYVQRALDVFLPAGYPQSVTGDYIQYQIYDSLQAFSSSIAGLLASRAVLEGVGVGDSSASPTNALLLSILQESMGRLATILFAHRLGTSLEPECKMYRLLADIFNDTAMVLDCLSPAFPKPARVALLSFSSCLRALCGVCAGSAKASLSAHFAKRGNLGELNAKDSSQETVISLLGMLAGSVVVSWVHSPMATWATLVVLLSIHLAMNYAAVRAVSMTSLNRQRANILFSSLLGAERPEVLSPEEVALYESVFERDGVLRWLGYNFGYCRIGVSLQTLLSRIGSQHKETGSLSLQDFKLEELLSLFAAEGYILWYDDRNSEVLIVLKKDCTALDQLKGWVHALMLVYSRATRKHTLPFFFQGAGYAPPRLNELEQTLQETRGVFEKYTEVLKAKGWNLETAALETRAGVRALIGTSKDAR